jgi:hypothetical protein
MHELFAFDSLIICQFCDKPCLYGSGSRCRGTEPVNQYGLFSAPAIFRLKHEFGELNSGFSVRVFTSSARDALSLDWRRACLSGQILCNFIRKLWWGISYCFYLKKLTINYLSIYFMVLNIFLFFISKICIYILLAPLKTWNAALKIMTY